MYILGGRGKDLNNVLTNMRLLQSAARDILQMEIWVQHISDAGYIYLK